MEKKGNFLAAHESPQSKIAKGLGRSFQREKSGSFIFSIFSMAWAPTTGKRLYISSVTFIDEAPYLEFLVQDCSDTLVTQLSFTFNDLFLVLSLKRSSANVHRGLKTEDRPIFWVFASFRYHSTEKPGLHNCSHPTRTFTHRVLVDSKHEACCLQLPSSMPYQDNLFPTYISIFPNQTSWNTKWSLIRCMSFLSRLISMALFLLHLGTPAACLRTLETGKKLSDRRCIGLGYPFISPGRHL